MEYVFWLGFCIAIGYWSINRGRSFWFGFLWSIVLSPLVGFWPLLKDIFSKLDFIK